MTSVVLNKFSSITRLYKRINTPKTTTHVDLIIA